MPIKIEINADTPEELEALLATFKPLLVSNGVQVQSVLVSNSDEENTPVAVMQASPAPKRGRPVGAKNKPKSAEPEEAIHASQTEADPSQPEEDEAAPEQCLSDADALKQGIEILTKVYGRVDKDGPKKVKDLQRQFGVVKFAELDASRADEFLKAAMAADKATQ